MDVNNLNSLFQKFAPQISAKTKFEPNKPSSSLSPDFFVSRNNKVGYTLAADNSSKPFPVENSGPVFSKLFQDAVNFSTAA